MEGVVAKRCLRESRQRIYNSDVDKKKLNSLYKKNMLNNKRVNSNEDRLVSKYVYKIKIKLWIQSINAMCILITVICCNMMSISKINNNVYVKKICEEYNKHYNFKQVLKNGKLVVNKSYNMIEGIIPDKIKEYSNNRLKKIKAYLKNDNKKKKVNIYLEETVKKEVNKEGKGVSITEDTPENIIFETSVEEPEEKEEVIESTRNRLEKEGITFVKPAEGKISSEFGDREVIFTDVDPFHTGIDIANKSGTSVISSTNGIITKVSNNKYNGNFIEITKSNVVTKYAHLKSINVKQGDNVEQGGKIGEMGQTGYATGPHLHFEVVVDGIKINPREVLDF